MRSVPFLRATALVFFATGQIAWAQAAPSADSMVDSLAGADLAKPCAAGCRGIHAVAPTQTGSNQGSPPRAATGHGTLDLSVQFATGSAALTPAAERLLTRLGQALTSPRLAGDRFRIEGHTDTVGDAAANQALSEQRAASVAAFLEKSFAIDAARLDTVGLGEKDLAVPTGDQVAEARNRRVHIVNLGS